MEPIGKHDDAGCEQRRDSIQLCARRDGDICPQNVPSHSTSDAGQHAEQRCHDGIESMRKRLVRSGHREESQPAGVEY